MSRQPPPSPWRPRWQMTERPDTAIHFLDAGGSGPPVVLLHGLAGHAGEWSRTMRHLASRWHTVALDQRGHGRSTRRPGDLSRPAFAADVVAVIAAACLEPPIVLVGQSMGAHTALVTAARYPQLVGTLVMIEGDVGGGGDTALTALHKALTSWPMPFADEDHALAYFGGEGELSRAWVEGLERRGDGLWPRWDLDVMLETMRPIFAHESWAEWEALAQPTLLVLGQSGMIDAGRVARMRATRPDTHLVTIPGAGHDLHLEQPEAWLQTLEAFLN